MKCVMVLKQRCRDGVMNDFLSCCMHLLVHLLFHEVTFLHIPLHFMEMIFPLVPLIFHLGAKPYQKLKVPVRGRVPYQPIAASRNSFESPSCAEYSAATVIAI